MERGPFGYNPEAMEARSTHPETVFELSPDRNIENEQVYSSRIDMRFFRHDDKENDKTKTDEEVSLTEAGKQHAKEQSFLQKITQAVAFGSPRRRTQETAAFTMAGQQDDITGTETLEELRAKIDGDRGYGSKIGVEKRLNFDIDMASAYAKEAIKALQKKEYLKFLVTDSDRVAAEFEDKNSSTYSRQAGAIADIIEKYMTIAPRFDKLVEAGGLEKDMQRFMGSHQGVGESFLAKVIDKTKGPEQRDAFVASLGNQGFDFSEGFEVEIKTKEAGVEPTVQVRFNKKDPEGKSVFQFNAEVPAATIREIAGEIK